MKQVEATGKSVNAAIENGLEMLGLTLCDVDVEILQQKGLFRPAKVRLTVSEDGEEELKKEFTAEVKKSAPVKKEERPVRREEKPVKKEEKKPVREEKKRFKDEPAAPVKAEPVKSEPVKSEPVKNVKPVAPEQAELAVKYLEKLLSLMKIDAEIKIDTADGNINVDLVTADGGVIGHRGEVLDALSVLTKRAVEEGEDKYVHVFVDSNGYRAKREQSLVALANRMAAKCIRTGKKVVLEPMSNNHRKVIHATLSGSDKVFTKSEGDEPNRKVVIMLKRKPQFKK